MTGPQATTARRAARDLLVAITDEGKLMSEAAPAILAPLAPADRARAQRLATGTLRWLQNCDRLLGPRLRNRPAPLVMCALRLGVWELCATEAAAHGVVNDLVGLLRADSRTASQAGLTNAVLRRISENRADWAALPVPELPKWLRKPLVADYGKAAVQAMEAVHAMEPPLDLTPRDGDAAALAARLGGAVTPYGSVRLTGAGQVSALAGFDRGEWWVQDTAAAIPARVLAPRRGERVLDLCAAPGGKTMQLAAAGAEVTALDISERRMERVAENLARTGLSATCVTADALTWEPPAPFDAILLDAPCSATGTIRRHPDLPQAKDSSSFPELFALQERLIDRALALLAPGGRLVFCTCSLLIDEGEEQVRDARARHPGLRVVPEPLHQPGIAPGWIGPEGLRLRPDHAADIGGMDGFFITCLQNSA